MLHNCLVWSSGTIFLRVVLSKLTVLPTELAVSSGTWWQCREMVRKRCRCGKKEREIQCYKEFQCDVKCTGLRDCGVHQCKRKVHILVCMSCLSSSLYLEFPDKQGQKTGPRVIGISFYMDDDNDELIKLMFTHLQLQIATSVWMISFGEQFHFQLSMEWG